MGYVVTLKMVVHLKLCRRHLYSLDLMLIRSSPRQQDQVSLTSSQTGILNVDMLIVNGHN